MSELPLDDVQWDAFAGHLDGVRVPQLMGCKAATHARIGGRWRSMLRAAAPDHGRPVLGPGDVAVADKDRAVLPVEVTLSERERLAHAEASSPQQDDGRACGGRACCRRHGA